MKFVIIPLLISGFFAIILSFYFLFIGMPTSEIVQPYHNQTADLICKDQFYGQIFFSSFNNLCSVRPKIATYLRRNSKEFIFKLYHIQEKYLGDMAVWLAKPSSINPEPQLTAPIWGNIKFGQFWTNLSAQFDTVYVLLYKPSITPTKANLIIHVKNEFRDQDILSISIPLASFSQKNIYPLPLGKTLKYKNQPIYLYLEAPQASEAEAIYAFYYASDLDSDSYLISDFVNLETMKEALQNAEHIETIKQNGRYIIDNKFLDLSFSSLSNSANKYYYLEGSSPDSKEEEAYSFWYNNFDVYPHGSAVRNGEILKGDIAFKTYFRPRKELAVEFLYKKIIEKLNSKFGYLIIIAFLAYLLSFSFLIWEVLNKRRKLP